MELQKANLEAQNSPNSGGSTTASGSTTTTTPSPLASALPLAQLLAKPGALNALSSLQALGGLTELLGLAGGLGSGSQVQTTGVHRSHTKSYNSRNRNNDHDDIKPKTERSKFAPY